MRGKQLLVHCLTAILIFSLGLGAGVVGCIAYSMHGRAQISAQKTRLQYIRLALLEYASANGAYPQRLEDVIDPKYIWSRTEAKKLEYGVAGKKYPLASRERLVWERWPRRYGFIEGTFELYEQDWFFKLDFSRRTPDEQI